MFLVIKAFFISAILIYACQPINLPSRVDFESETSNKVSINAKDIITNIKYDPLFSENNIEDLIINSPIKRLKKLLSDNISYFGNENLLIIDVLDASIIRKEIENNSENTFEEQIIYHYEIFFKVDFKLLDNNEYLLANAKVETKRSTTSQKYISLNDFEIITNDLISKSLIDFNNETLNQFKKHMSSYLK